MINNNLIATITSMIMFLVFIYTNMNKTPQKIDNIEKFIDSDKINEDIEAYIDEIYNIDIKSIRDLGCLVEKIFVHNKTYNKCITLDNVEIKGTLHVGNKTTLKDHKVNIGELTIFRGNIITKGYTPINDIFNKYSNEFNSPQYDKYNYLLGRENIDNISLFVDDNNLQKLYVNKITHERDEHDKREIEIIVDKFTTSKIYEKDNEDFYINMYKDYIVIQDYLTIGTPNSNAFIGVRNDNSDILNIESYTRLEMLQSDFSDGPKWKLNFISDEPVKFETGTYGSTSETFGSTIRIRGFRLIPDQMPIIDIWSGLSNVPLTLQAKLPKVIADVMVDTAKKLSEYSISNNNKLLNYQRELVRDEFFFQYIKIIAPEDMLSSRAGKFWRVANLTKGVKTLLNTANAQQHHVIWRRPIDVTHDVVRRGVHPYANLGNSYNSRIIIEPEQQQWFEFLFRWDKTNTL